MDTLIENLEAAPNESISKKLLFLNREITDKEKEAINEKGWFYHIEPVFDNDSYNVYVATEEFIQDYYQSGGIWDYS